MLGPILEAGSQRCGTWRRIIDIIFIENTSITNI